MILSLSIKRWRFLQVLPKFISITPTVPKDTMVGVIDAVDNKLIDSSRVYIDSSGFYYHIILSLVEEQVAIDILINLSSMISEADSYEKDTFNREDYLQMFKDRAFINWTQASAHLSKALFTCKKVESRNINFIARRYTSARLTPHKNYKMRQYHRLLFCDGLQQSQILQTTSKAMQIILQNSMQYIQQYLLLFNQYLVMESHKVFAKWMQFHSSTLQALLECSSRNFFKAWVFLLIYLLSTAVLFFLLERRISLLMLYSISRPSSPKLIRRQTEVSIRRIISKCLKIS